LTTPSVTRQPATLPDFDTLKTCRICALPRKRSRTVGASMPLSIAFTSSITL